MTEQKRNTNRLGTVLPSVVLDETPIVESQFVDYLGVRLDGGLRWNDHVDRLAKQLSANIFALKNISSLNNIALSKLVYFGLIESLIRYSIVLWGSSSSSNLNRIFVLQKRAVRCILKLRPTESCLDHFKELGFLTVPSIYMYEVITFVKEQHLVKAHQHIYNTRNKNFNPSISHNLKLYETKPEYIGLKLLSQLPSVLNKINDLNKFKRELKNYLINKCYYQLPNYLT